MSPDGKHGPASPTEPAVRPSPARRGLLLAACIVVGSAVGALGQALTGSGAWWLAVPVAMAAVWLFVADPSCCEAGPGR